MDLQALDNGLFVVETHDDAFVGQLVIDRQHNVHVLNGFVGRPVVLPSSEVVSIIAASQHPDVEVLV